jgi:hypothetical protein
MAHGSPVTESIDELTGLFAVESTQMPEGVRPCRDDGTLAVPNVSPSGGPRSRMIGDPAVGRPAGQAAVRVMSGAVE